MLLQVFHVGDPFDDKEPIPPVDVMHQVCDIGRGEMRRVFAVEKLFCKVEKGLESFCERIMLEYDRIFKERDKDSFFLG